MRKGYGKLVAVGLSLMLGLYGCGGASSNEPAPSSDDEAIEESAPADESASGEENAPVEEEQESEPVAAVNLESAELEVAGCDYHYELNEVSSFAGERRDISFQYKGAIGFDGDNAQLLGLDGKPLLDGAAVKSIECWDNGIYLYRLDNDEVNSTGLVSLTDGILIPAETALVSYKTDTASDARFVEAIYATEETDNKDECFIFASDALFALAPGEEDTMYKGYGKVFDLKKGSFVEGVEIENGMVRALRDLGDAFMVLDNDDVYTMYDENGKELWHSNLLPSVGLHSFVDSNKGSAPYSILDCAGKVTFETEDYLNTLTSTSDLCVLTDSSGAKYAVDSQGHRVLEGSYDNIIMECSGLFVVESDEVAKIVDGKGSVLVDNIDGFSTKQVLPGIISYSTSDGNHALLLTDGTVIDVGDVYTGDLTCEKDDKYLVIKDGTFSLELSSGTGLSTGLVKGHTDSTANTYGLYDLFTGKELLESTYEAIDWAGGYIYAFKDGTWTVYEAKLVQG